MKQLEPETHPAKIVSFYQQEFAMKILFECCKETLFNFNHPKSTPDAAGRR